MGSCDIWFYRHAGLAFIIYGKFVWKVSSVCVQLPLTEMKHGKSFATSIRPDRKYNMNDTSPYKVGNPLWFYYSKSSLTVSTLRLILMNWFNYLSVTAISTLNESSYASVPSVLGNKLWRAVEASDWGHTSQHFVTSPLPLLSTTGALLMWTFFWHNVKVLQMASTCNCFCTNRKMVKGNYRWNWWKEKHRPPRPSKFQKKRTDSVTSWMSENLTKF